VPSVIDGTKYDRSIQYSVVSMTPNVHYVIISYDYVLLDSEYMTKLAPEMVILDEASAIKSFKTQRSKKIKKLFKDVPYRLALTATPIENKPEELYSIMQFVDSSVLGRYDLFEKAYVVRHAKGWVRAYKNLDVLNQRMGDAMIRKARTDPDVSPYLPEVDEGNWVVPLDNRIIKIYCDIAADMLIELDKIPTHKVDLKYGNMEAEDTPNGRLMAMHMCLEMLLCHPSLIYNSAAKYLENSPEGSEYAWLLVTSDVLGEVPLSSAKLDMLKTELEAILDNPDSKVLVYSKYKFMLDIIKRELPYKSVMFTGDMSAREKDKARKQFADDPTMRIFLSSYAGGYGLDMNMADYLVNYDLPWSFGTQDQINSRHVRASSAFSQVFVRNLITYDSIEERKMRVLERKRRISDLAIDGNTDSGDNITTDTSVVLDSDFLRKHLTQFIIEHGS
jgi:SNF2 family DNA or RNA helicase